MSDPADKIRQQMRSIRREIGADVQEIATSAHELVDWRYYVRKFPWVCLGSAFAVGYLLAPKRRKAGRDDWEALVAHVRDGNDHQGNAAPAAKGEPSSLTRGLLGQFVSMAWPIAAKAAVNYLATRMDEKSRHDEEEPELGETFDPMEKPR